MTNVLKPCPNPWCLEPMSALALHYPGSGDTWSMTCRCGVKGPFSDTRENAAAMWNIRSPAPGAAEMREALESYDYWIDNAVTGSDRDALREASDTLADFVRRALPAPEVPDMWTATKDAMPEKSRGLLAFCQGFEEHSGATWRRTGFAFMAWHRTGWSEQHMRDARERLAADSLEVTHWMYLTEPKEAR